MNDERPSGVAWALSRIGAEVSRRFADRVAPLGLSAPDAATLRAVSHGPASQRDLARRMGLAPSRMVVLVDSLEERGLVERTVDGEDRRRRVVTLTTAGRTCLGALREVATEHDRDITAGLGDADRAQLAALLDRLQDHLDLPRHGHPGMR